jgi:hypothetical protein
VYQKSTVPVPINGSFLGVKKKVYLKGYKVDYVWGNYTRRGIKKRSRLYTGTLYWNGRESFDSLPSGGVITSYFL